MSSLSSDTLINPQDLFDVSGGSTNDGTNLGGLATTGDGRYFRWALAGASALVPGKLQQAPAEVTGNENLSFAAASAGATQITSSSTVTVTANQYAGGWVVVTNTAGQGYQYQIGSHAAASSAVVTLNLVDPLIVAITTGSHIDLVANPYNGVIVNPATATANPVGVAVAATPAAGYGWIQVRGIATVLADGAVTVGTNVVASNAIAGAVEPATGVQALVGIAATGIADTDYGAVNLTIG